MLQPEHEKSVHICKPYMWHEDEISTTVGCDPAYAVQLSEVLATPNGMMIQPPPGRAITNDPDPATTSPGKNATGKEVTTKEDNKQRATKKAKTQKQVGCNRGCVFICGLSEVSRGHCRLLSILWQGAELKGFPRFLCGISEASGVTVGCYYGRARSWKCTLWPTQTSRISLPIGRTPPPRRRDKPPK